MLTNEQIQVILTGKFGDGCLATNSQAKLHPERNYNYYYMTSSIHKNYLVYKKQLLGNLCNHDINQEMNRGYKSDIIYKLASISHPQITEIFHESIDKSLYRLDDLGFALWIYDDGSLHQKKQFYNLNTQSFSKEENYDIIVPFLKTRFDITAIPTIERKKDGREYWYLRIKRYDGAFIVSEILSRYPVECFKYKCIDEDTLLKWKKVQENALNSNIDLNLLHPKTIGCLIKKTVL